MDGEVVRFLHRFGISKVSEIVPGGPTGHDSIYNGLVALRNRAIQMILS